MDPGTHSRDDHRRSTEIRDHMLWHLTRLGDELGERGRMPQLEHVEDPMPRLWVRDEEINQRIFVAPVDGVWWFWWPWVERIVECHDVASAADRICATARVRARATSERTPLDAFETWADRPFPGIEGRLAKLRRYVRDMLADHPCRDDAEQIATELAGNAIAHTRSGAELGAYRVAIYIGADMVRVEIHDSGGVDTEPDVVVPDERGYGMQLVEGLADRWECEGDATDGRCVWAELSAHPYSLPVPVARHGPAG